MLYLQKSPNGFKNKQTNKQQRRIVDKTLNLHTDALKIQTWHTFMCCVHLKDFARTVSKAKQSMGSEGPFSLGCCWGCVQYPRTAKQSRYGITALLNAVCNLLLKPALVVEK